LNVSRVSRERSVKGILYAADFAGAGYLFKVMLKAPAPRSSARTEPLVARRLGRVRASTEARARIDSGASAQ
jgi:hypothetical protein